MAFGVLIGALAAIPSDAPQFFLFLGIHFFTCGLLGVAALWCRAPIVLALTLRLASFIANATLASRIAAMILYGAIRGPLVVAALLLVGIPIGVNLVAAVVVSSKKSSDDAV
ncbi:hypothetical protein SH139x_002187 [Planctomycetaceae bacterium SH139]